MIGHLIAIVPEEAIPLMQCFAKRSAMNTYCDH